MKTQHTKKSSSIDSIADFDRLKNVLDFHYQAHNSQNAINRENLDPLLKVKEYINSHLQAKTDKIPYIALVCALFAYGNVKAILKFLDSLDFDLLDSKEAILRSDFAYYRFQNAAEVKLFFLALCEMREDNKLESLLKARDKSAPIYCFVNDCISAIWSAAQKWAKDYELPKMPQNTKNNSAKNSSAKNQKANSTESKSKKRNNAKNNFNGFAFLVGTPLPNSAILPSSPLKRWNMFLRWLVRSDNIDLGLWGESIHPSELLLPLDTHTFSVCRALGILQRKSYDFRAVLEVSENLARFDKNDPIKYDFALYRLGQKGIIKKGEKIDLENLCQ